MPLVYVISIYENENDQHLYRNIALGTYFCCYVYHKLSPNLYWFKTQDFQLHCEVQDNHVSSPAAGLSNTKSLQPLAALGVSP